MRSLRHVSSAGLLLSLPLALVGAPGVRAQEPAPDAVPAPATAEQGQPVDGPEAVPGRRVDPAAFGPAVIEDMAEVLRRQEEGGAAVTPSPADRNGAQGEWEVPGLRWVRNPHSGSRHVINRWGDTRMAIGFGREVDLVGAWVAGQGSEGVWADGLQAVGYRNGEEVARTEWLESIGPEPAWFEIGLEGVDRVELVARPVIEGAGWYALDDLTFEVPGEDGAEERVVLDFEDVRPRTILTGSGYAGLDWEVGRGDFVQPAREMPPPRVPPGFEQGGEAEPAAGGTAKLGGAGTTPRLVRELDGPRFGDPGCCWLPPDTCGSVGPDHFVAVTNVNLSVYDKTSGQRTLNVSLADFFGEGVGDPRVTYDVHHDRWAVLAMTGPAARVHFAYSLSGDPTATWFKTVIDTAQDEDAGRWADYPTLGVDVAGVYLASHMVGPPDTMSIWAIDKAPLLAATPSMGTVSVWRNLPWEGAIQPCVTYGDSGGVYLVSRRSWNSLRLRQITGLLTAPTLVQVGNPVVPSHGNAPGAPQKGTVATLGTLDIRPINAVYRDGSVWTTHTVTVDGRAGVRWYELDVATATAVQVGTVADESLYFYMPSISVNAERDVLLGFTGSDEDTYAGAWLTGRRASDPPGVTGAPLLFKPGEGPHTQMSSSGFNRWGDYSLTSVDPLDDETFWTIQEYSGSNPYAWTTHIAQADFDCTAATYCTTKLSSTLCAPAMTWSGTPQLVLAPFFEVRVKGMQSKVNGIMFFGLSGPAAKPFQGGTLCVASPIYRLPGRNSGGSGGCTGSFAYTLADILATPAGAQIQAGSRVCVQAWARDTGDPYGSSLSDGLTFEVCP